MDTYRRLDDLPPIADSVLTVGTFDGLHRGHLAVISRLVEKSRSKAVPTVVITFDPHPQHILASPGTPKLELIATLNRKLILLEKAGVDLTLVLRFDTEFSRITAVEFLEKIIVDHFHPSHIIVGYDHHFGNQRQGNAQFLREHARVYGYEADIVQAVDDSDTIVSSANIRQLLREGHCTEAEQLLGWPYEIPGKIMPGTGRGRMLDYPTANLTPEESTQLIPKAGVYIVSADVHGQTIFGMCNVGYRPTFNGKALSVEAHFFDLPENNLYNQTLAFRFHHRLRDEQKFSNAAELRNQLDRDRHNSMEWINQHQGGKPVHAAVS
ncbi:MAG: bifunctional riboflavin kinase/FAD synthetase [Fidelibacterota bacterium]|nr:MAG: bifunctional riboflavin kinase/FAD synthetase [Candidatus Neomarinimicrobiota bacterium]